MDPIIQFIPFSVTNQGSSEQFAALFVHVEEYAHARFYVALVVVVSPRSITGHEIGRGAIIGIYDGTVAGSNHQQQQHHHLVFGSSR